MSECEPLSRPTWVLGVIPVTGAPNPYWKSCNGIIVFHREFLNSFSLTTELPDSIAAGLSRILLSPDLASTCLQQLVIRFSKAASAQGLQTCANQVFKHLQVFRPFAFRFALSFPRNFCTRENSRVQGSHSLSRSFGTFARQMCTELHLSFSLALFCLLFLSFVLLFSQAFWVAIQVF